VQTDHASLQYIISQEHLSPRLARWLERLIDFDLKIVHISGKVNLVADALSRSPKDIPSRDNTIQAILLDDLRRTTPRQSHSTKIDLISSLHDGSGVVCQKKAASLLPTSRARDVAGFIYARCRSGLDSTRCNGKIGRCNGRKTRYSKRDYSDVSVNG
jgi:hypothetical protein